MQEGIWFSALWLWKLLSQPEQCSSSEKQKQKFAFGTGGHGPVHWKPEEVLFQTAERVL